MKTPYDFHAHGDGVTDDSLALQKWLDFGANRSLALTDGIFKSTRSLVVHSHTAIYGQGGVIVAATGDAFPANAHLLTNEHLSNGDRLDGDIKLIAVRMMGDPDRETFGSLCAFVGVTGLAVPGSSLGHWRRLVLQIANTVDINLDDLELYDGGSRSPVPLPGACQYDGGSALWTQEVSDVRGRGLYIHDCEWSGIQMSGKRWALDDFRIMRVRETGIFGGPEDSRLTRGTIIGVPMKDCSSHGLEIGGRNYVLDDIVIAECGGANIYLSNVVQVGVYNCTLSTPNQQFKPADPPQIGSGYGGITLRNAAELGPPGKQIEIRRNLLSDASGKSTYGIAAYDFGAGAFDDMNIVDNNLGDPAQWKGQPIYVAPGARGQRCIIQGEKV